MSPRRRKIHEHLPHTFDEVIDTIAQGKPKEIKKTKPENKEKRKKSQ